MFCFFFNAGKKDAADAEDKPGDIISWTQLNENG